MICSLLGGRIGNCMFEIAAGASLAKRLSVPYKVLAEEYSVLNDKREKVGHYSYLEEFRGSILRKVDFVNELPDGLAEYQDPAFSYTALPEKDNMLLKGYFQSEKYFDKELVRNLFKIDDGTRDYITGKYGHVLNRENVVSVGVRRGDYLLLKHQFTICEMYYYRRAMRYLGKDNTFLIISDDPVWCRKHFRGENIYFSENESGVVDLYLHSMCKHNIIPNSTFAWWGAWLNPNPGKVVIYPTPWFRGDHYKNYKASDLCPDEWIPMQALSKASSFFYKTEVPVFYYRCKFRCRSLISNLLGRLGIKEYVKKYIN